MTQKELAEMYGIKSKISGLKDKEKVKNVAEKILRCPKCKKTMKWVVDTNSCYCENCATTYGKGESSYSVNTTKQISDHDIRFLEKNYSNYLIEIENNSKENE